MAAATDDILTDNSVRSRGSAERLAIWNTYRLTYTDGDKSWGGPAHSFPLKELQEFILKHLNPADAWKDSLDSKRAPRTGEVQPSRGK